MSTSKILKGTTILGIAGILVKLLGAVFRIPLTALIGTEGMAYYGYAYPLYSLFLVIATAGIPVAISRMVSERAATGDYIGVQRVFAVSRWLLLSIGVAAFAICFFGAELIAEYISKDMGAVLPIRAIAPALIFVPVMSAYRGYFQGRQNMNPTAISQFVEQIFRVAVGLILASVLVSSGLEVAAAGATFGATVGSVAGLAVIMLIYALNKKAIQRRIQRSRTSLGERRREKSKDLVKQILIIAIPITIGASILPLINFADSAIVTRRLLDGGFSTVEARELWGQLSGYCNTMIGLPQVLTQAVAVAEAVERGLNRRKAEGLPVDTMGPVCTLMIGRTDDWLKKSVSQTGQVVDPECLEWGGVAVIKEAYRIYKEKGYTTRLLSAANRNHYHWSQLIGGDLAQTINYSWHKRLNASDIEVVSRIDDPVPESIMKELQKIPEFHKSFEADAMKPEEFEKYGGFRDTLASFISGYDDLCRLIRGYMI